MMVYEDCRKILIFSSIPKAIFFKKLGQVWHDTPVIPELGHLKREDIIQGLTGLQTKDHASKKKKERKKDMAGFLYT
jgi:hypothetical protein